MKKSLGNVFILGDSYSTYEGFVPQGYRSYYESFGDPNEGKLRGVEKTWWFQLLEETHSVLICNNSYSGTTVCKTGYNGAFCDEQSFVTRIQKYLIEGKYEGQIVDTVIVFGGTNDSWANSPMGEIKYSDFCEEDFKSFLPSYSFILHYLTEVRPPIRIISVVNCHIKAEIIKTMVDISKKYGIEYVVLKNIEIMNGHPTETGMEQIKNQILAIV